MAARMKIPGHLQDRPRWNNLPVPYINAVGVELDEQQWTPKWDNNVRQPAWFTAPNPARFGPADFTKQCLQRQREVTVRGLCQVCAHPVPHDRRLLLLFDGSYQQAMLDGYSLTANGRPIVAVSEPWICHRCLPYVLTTCPGVRRRRDEAQVWELTRWEVILSTGWHDTHGRSVVAAMWAKVVPQVYDIRTPDQYL